VFSRPMKENAKPTREHATYFANRKHLQFSSSCDVNELPISSDTHSCPNVPKRGNTVFKTTTWSFIQICFRISGRF
jgi:hypothetical protein